MNGVVRATRAAGMATMTNSLVKYHAICQRTFKSVSAQMYERCAVLADRRGTVPDVNKRADAHVGTIVWLHGLGDSNEGFCDMFENIVLPQLVNALKRTRQASAKSVFVRCVLPNAPVRPITVNMGMEMRGWYDILTLDRGDSLSIDEDREGIDQSAAFLDALLDSEVALLGGEANRLVLGGFSQGGAMAVYTGLGYRQHALGGIISASGYMLRADQYPQRIAQPQTPVLAYHGMCDPMVPYAFAKRSYDLLEEHGINVDLRSEDVLEHSISDAELGVIHSFLVDTFASQ